MKKTLTKQFLCIFRPGKACFIQFSKICLSHKICLIFVAGLASLADVWLLRPVCGDAASLDILQPPPRAQALTLSPLKQRTDSRDFSNSFLSFTQLPTAQVAFIELISSYFQVILVKFILVFKSS